MGGVLHTTAAGAAVREGGRQWKCDIEEGVFKVIQNANFAACPAFRQWLQRVRTDTDTGEKSRL